MERNQVFRLVQYIWPHWYLLPPVLFCMISATLLSLAPPWLMGVILIDRVILSKESSLLPWVVLGVLGSVIFRQAFDFAQRYLLALLSQRAIHQLRCDLYLHLEQLPLSYFSRTPVGDLVSRQVNDADSLEDGLQALVTEAGVHLILMLGTLALLFSLNASLGHLQTGLRLRPALFAGVVEPAGDTPTTVRPLPPPGTASIELFQQDSGG